MITKRKRGLPPMPATALRLTDRHVSRIAGATEFTMGKTIDEVHSHKDN